jgi:hypothetical protein
VIDKLKELSRDPLKIIPMGLPIKSMDDDAKKAKLNSDEITQTVKSIDYFK